MIMIQRFPLSVIKTLPRTPVSVRDRGSRLSTDVQSTQGDDERATHPTLTVPTGLALGFLERIHLFRQRGDFIAQCVDIRFLRDIHPVEDIL